MPTAAQKTFTAYKVGMSDPANLTAQIAAHVAGLTAGKEALVERLELYEENGTDVALLIMSSYSPLDTSIVSLGGGKTGALNAGGVTLSFIAPFNGKIISAQSRVSADPGAGGTTMQLKVNGGTASTVAIQHPNAAAANSLVTATFPDNNVVVAGDKVELISTNTAANAVTAIVGLLMQKTA